MEKPFFSIIIPTFNSENTLGNALTSILNQSFINYEILIVDGFSKDKTISIAEKFCEQRIKIISEKDEGVYDAMNKGIIKSNGQWLYFLGSDDYMTDRFVLRDVANFIKSYSEAKVVYGNVNFLNEKPFWAANKEVYDGEFSFKKLTDQNICHQAIFYNREFIRKNRLYYNTSFPICADWDMNIRCWIKQEFYYLDRVIAIFSAGGLSSTSSDDFNKKKKKLIVKYSVTTLQFILFAVKTYTVGILNKLKGVFK